MELESAEFAGAASALVVSIRCHHHDWQIGATLLELAEQFQTIHAGHVDVREHRSEGWLDILRKPIQCLNARCGEMHDVFALAGFTTETLAKQVCDIRFVVHDKDTDAHDAASGIVTG